MKAILLARVSTNEQGDKNNSIPAQLDRMRLYCSDNNLKVHSKEYEWVETAHKSKRDEFDVVLEEIAKHKEKIAICFDKVDRLSRNIFDKRVAFLYEKAVNNEIELHFVSDNQIVNDKMNAGDKFMFGIKLGLAKYYSDAISDNVKRTLEKKRRNGEWTNMAPLGYLNVTPDINTPDKKDIILDPERHHLILKMFEMYASGNHSLASVQKEITKAGLRSRKGKELSKSIVESILKNSFYYGIAMPKKHRPYPHKYPVIITQILFDKCEDVRSRRRKMPSKATSKQFVLGKGLLKCKNCNCTISPEEHIQKNGTVQKIYSCTNAKGICKREYVNEEVLLKPVYEILDKFATIPKETQETLIDELRKTTEAEAEYHKAQVTRIDIEYKKIQQMSDNLMDAFLDPENQSITKDIYDKKHQELQDKLQNLNIEKEEHTSADFEYKTTVATVLSLARRAKDIFINSSEVAEKRAFLGYLLQNPVVYDKKLEFTLASPFNHILDLSTCTELQG